MQRKPYFYLYAHVVPVRGAKRSAFYDLQRQQLVPIPTVLYELLAALRQAPWQQVQAQYAPTNPALFEKYLRFLLDQDLGIFVDSLAPFPPLALGWHSPHRVQNAVVEYDFAHYSLADVLRQLDGLSCRHLELRLGPAADWAQVRAMCQQLDKLCFKSVTLLLAYSPQLATGDLVRGLYERFKSLQYILVHQAPISLTREELPGRVAFVAHDLCKEAPRTRYLVNLEYFSEAQEFNPYFNRKVCVSATGALKNCLLLPHSFGHATTHRLAEVLDEPAFRVLWHAAPDRTAGLRESELRYAHFSADYLVPDAASGLFVPASAVLQPTLAEEELFT